MGQPKASIHGYMLLLALATACAPTAKDMQDTAHSTQEMATDTQNAWRKVFTYTRPAKPQLPQTRYCYQMQSDIVCYDSPQNGLTAKMIGYQDGASISWVQPGGGSLGVSGGEPTAPHDAKMVQVAPNVTGGTAAVIDTAPPPAMATNMSAATDHVVDCTNHPDPFYCKESPYVKTTN